MFRYFVYFWLRFNSTSEKMKQYFDKVILLLHLKKNFFDF